MKKVYTYFAEWNENSLTTVLVSLVEKNCNIISFECRISISLESLKNLKTIFFFVPQSFLQRPMFLLFSKISKHKKLTHPELFKKL